MPAPPPKKTPPTPVTHPDAVTTWKQQEGGELDDVLIPCIPKPGFSHSRELWWPTV